MKNSTKSVGPSSLKSKTVVKSDDGPVIIQSDLGFITVKEAAAITDSLIFVSFR